VAQAIAGVRRTQPPIRELFDGDTADPFVACGAPGPAFRAIMPSSKATNRVAISVIRTCYPSPKLLQH
jgi:hypothetical protein